MATKVRKQKQRPGPAARAPRERYPLAIVIDHATWRRWEQFKQEMGALPPDPRQQAGFRSQHKAGSTADPLVVEQKYGSVHITATGELPADNPIEPVFDRGHTLYMPSGSGGPGG
jgi:hypothetical protein